MKSQIGTNMVQINNNHQRRQEHTCYIMIAIMIYVSIPIASSKIVINESKIKSNELIRESTIKNNSKIRNIDLIFMIDTTGSMPEEINEVKKNVITIINRMKDLDLMTGSLKLGVIEYKDYVDNPITDRLDLTDDLNNISYFINSLKSSGGGDLPEAVANAFNSAYNNISWREESIKMIIWIADACPHQLRPNSYFKIDNKEINFSQIYETKHSHTYSYPLYWEPELNALKELGVIVHSILVRNDNDTKNIMKEVSKRTRGIVITLNNSSYISDLITSLAIEGLDRVRVSEDIEDIIKENINKLKFLSNNQLKTEFIKNNLRGKNTEILRLFFSPLISNDNSYDYRNEDKDIIINLNYTSINDEDIFYSINYLDTCTRYNVFCDLDNKIIPKSGLIANYSEYSLPLIDMVTEVSCLDDISDITIHQVYNNTNNDTVTGELVLPLPENSAIYEFEALIDNQEIISVVLEKNKANTIYKNAMKDNNSAFLLSEESSNVFRINLGNIPAGSAITIKIKLITLLEKFNDIEEDSIEYLFTFPSFIYPLNNNDNSNQSDHIKYTNYVKNSLLFKAFTSPNYSNIDIKLGSIESNMFISTKIDDNTLDLKNLNTNTDTIIKIIAKRSNNIRDKNKMIISSFNNYLYYSLNNKSLIGETIHPNSLDFPYYSSYFDLYFDNNQKNNASNIIKDSVNGIEELTILVDLSKSIYSNFDLITDTLKELLLILNSRIKSNNSILINIYSFNTNCELLLSETLSENTLSKLLKKLESINSIDFRTGSFFSDCINLQLSRNNIEFSKRRFLILSDGFFSDELESYDIIDYLYNKHNIKTELIGLGYKVNRRFLNKLNSISNKPMLMINKIEERTNKKLNSLIDDLFHKKGKISIEIYNSKQELLYESNNENNQNTHHGILVDSNFILDLSNTNLRIYAMFDKNLFNDIKVIEDLTLVVSLININTNKKEKYYSFILKDIINIVDNSSIDYFVANNIIYNKQNTIDSINNYNYQKAVNSEDYNGLKNSLKKDIVNICTHYSLVSKYTSYLAMKKDLLEKYMLKYNNKNEKDCGVDGSEYEYSGREAIQRERNRGEIKYIETSTDSIEINYEPSVINSMSSRESYTTDSLLLYDKDYTIPEESIREHIKGESRKSIERSEKGKVGENSGSYEKLNFITIIIYFILLLF